ncbi:gamma-glutamylcyclotransferase family protein [Gracilimonas mengyeensis]|uniref:AIG2-like family protein n=1 Tax=Gracilimonas mengyeensis TaxID=1302730 RepID=A0A521DEP9_9BACT|nr:gamma-glutamylcyclotransferase family protein [Gracilimonas mengyeensis]SMO70274.1 AIG2-like family protein [Gracilimonas mengyeensis]
MKNRYYFAYGSNLHPLRLRERLGKSEAHGRGRLPMARLLFNKSARDGSGKGNIAFTENLLDEVFGSIYKLSKKQERLLNRYEALGHGYHKIDVGVELDDKREITCFTYQAMPGYTDPEILPYNWYKQLVYLGAEYMEFPEPYLQKIQQTPSIEDPQKRRARKNKQLIQKMQLQKKPQSS